MKFIKRHLTAIIVVFICILLLVLAGFAMYRMFYPSGDKSIYGNRLDNAPEISDETISNIKDELNASELVNSVDYRLSVKTMKFTIDVKSDTKVDDAKKLGDIVIKNLSSEITKFYDITVYLTQKEGEMVDYPAIGQHAKGSDKFNWVVNKEVSDSEK